MAKYEKGTFTVVPNKQILSGLPPTVQAVYFWICSCASDDGTCFPSRTTLARHAGCSVRSVDKALNTLCEKGILQKSVRQHPGSANYFLSNMYQIMIVEGSAPFAPPRAENALGGSAPDAQRTISNLSNEKGASPSFEVVNDEPEKKKNPPRDKAALRLRAKLYDVFAKEYGHYPVMSAADYYRVLAALKRIKEKDVITLVEDGVSQGKRTVSECLTDRAITIYLQDNA